MTSWTSASIFSPSLNFSANALAKQRLDLLFINRFHSASACPCWASFVAHRQMVVLVVEWPLKIPSAFSTQQELGIVSFVSSLFDAPVLCRVCLPDFLCFLPQFFRNDSRMMISYQVFRLFPLIDLLFMPIPVIGVGLLTKYGTAVTNICDHVPNIRCRPPPLIFFLCAPAGKTVGFRFCRCLHPLFGAWDMQGIQLLGDLREAQLFL